jgi:hypothetical protein
MCSGKLSRVFDNPTAVRVQLPHHRREMLDAALERVIVALTDNNLYVTGIVVDERFA